MKFYNVYSSLFDKEPPPRTAENNLIMDSSSNCEVVDFISTAAFLSSSSPLYRRFAIGPTKSPNIKIRNFYNPPMLPMTSKMFE
jgi:hypothetical protein